MALSPWHVAPQLRFDDVAALLTGFDISLARTGNVHDHEIKEYKEWCKVIIRAAKDGALNPSQVEICVEDAVSDPSNENNLVLGMDWQLCGDESWRWYPDNDIRLKLERKEVCRWLRASGIAEDDIPEVLRVIPKPQAAVGQQNKPIHHHRRKTYLKLIEGLALDALGGEIPAEPYAAAAALQAVLERHALKLDDEPIAKTVKEIQAIREERESDPFNSM